MRKVREEIEDTGHSPDIKGQVQGLLFPVHIGTGRVGTQRNSREEQHGQIDQLLCTADSQNSLKQHHVFACCAFINSE